VPTKRQRLTKAGEFNQVTHIYPFCLGSRFTAARPSFCSASSLRIFWTTEEVETGSRRSSRTVPTCHSAATAHFIGVKRCLASNQSRYPQINAGWSAIVHELWPLHHLLPHSNLLRRVSNLKVVRVNYKYAEKIGGGVQQEVIFNKRERYYRMKTLLSTKPPWLWDSLIHPSFLGFSF